MRRAVAALIAVAAAGCGRSEPAPAAAPVAPACFAVRGRWPDPSRIRVRLEFDGSPLAAGAFAAAVERAMQAWNDTGVVGFELVAEDQPADLSLGFRRGHHGACEPFGPGTAVAHTGFSPRPFVHFDVARDWSEHGPQGVSLFATTLHELGHVLGLGHADIDDAVMSNALQLPQRPSWHDRSGLFSLYGGGADSAGDLRLLRGDGSAATTLRAVAPPQTCAFACFDCDGDGRDEVVVWRTDAAGHGVLMRYVLDDELRLVRTVGPFVGAVLPGAAVGFVVSPGGERLLVATPPAKMGAAAAVVVRQFDQLGVPALPTARVAADVLARAAIRVAGDFDGDGAPDGEVRRAQ